MARQYMGAQEPEKGVVMHGRAALRRGQQMVDQGHCAGPREILLQRRLDCGVVCRLDLSLQDRDHRLEVVFRTLMNLRHDRKSEEHTSELQSLMRISYAVFCLKKKI